MVHFESGCYYSTDNLGTEIFQYIERSEPVDAIIKALAAKHGEGVAYPVRAFVHELCKETLIVPVDEADASSVHAGESHDESSGMAVPVLHKYNDLEDLLLLDPIHDTDETGWPMPKPDDNPNSEREVA